MIRHLFVYRRYIWQTAWNELRYRYAGTGLGVFWNLANPVLEVLIYTLVFTQVIVVRAGDEPAAPFVLYLCVGLFPWLAFAETLIQGSNALLENANYLKRLAMPAEIFVAKNVLTTTFSLYISLLLLIPFSLFLGEPLGWSWLLLPVVILLLQALGLGLALLLAGLRVFFRDIGEALRAVLQLWKWTMPIVYPAALMPETLRPWLPLNPPYLFIESIRNLFLEQQLPSLWAWATMLGWILLVGLAGVLVMHGLQTEIRDNL